MKIIVVKTTSGAEDEMPYSDYYIQDGILTVVRNEEVKTSSTTYYEFTKHYFIDKVVSVMEVEE